jgi:hypothetical protein
MTSILQIRRVFKLYPKWDNVEANENLAMEACGNREDVHIGNEIEKLGAAGKLAVAQNYSDAYRRFFEKHPEFTVQANVALLDSVLVHFCEPVTFENLEELLMPGNPRNVLGQLVITAEATQAQTEARETDRMISKITAYMMDANGKLKREYLPRQYNEKIAGLRAMPFSQLVARHDEVTRGRALRNTPVEAVRATVKVEAQSQRKNIFYPAPPEVELVNPHTTQPFASRKELVNFLNGLSRTETRAFFFFPEGRQKPGVSEAVSKMLNGGSKNAI